MAADRFVYWNDRKPTVEELKRMLEDYLGGMGKIEDMPQKDKKPWWVVTLPGAPTCPFQRIDGYEKYGVAMRETKERWFEVYVDDEEKHVDVMTRQGDELTGVIANGFAELLRRFWEAKLEV